ncbi:hypothetical protein V2J09_017692 [Rumex salicifolius]
MSSRICIPRPALLSTSITSNGAHGPRHLRWRIMQRKPYEAVREEDKQPTVLEPVQLIVPKQEEVVGEDSRSSDLRFTRLQPSNPVISQPRREFGDFVARDAFLDEEYWTAAWLRAESHWEHQPHDRYTNNNKRKFAEQEFHAIKRRGNGHHVQNCSCIVTVKKEDRNIKRTVLKSVVGTLDLSIRYLLQGESFPGERVKPPLFCGIQKSASNRYGYIANLCVTKLARRKGIATNMLLFAVESAKLNGVDEVFVHVYRDNTAARQLYQKIGFKIVEDASPQLVEDKMYLLCCNV